MSMRTTAELADDSQQAPPAAVEHAAPEHAAAPARRGAPEADPVLWAGLVDQPFEHDLFMLLRRLDAHGGHPLLGLSLIHI